VSPILTAHWYGRLHADYLDKLENDSRRWAGTGRPLFVTEYGDWGLPDMPTVPNAPFWDTRAVYAAGLAGTLWPGTIGRFVRETQRYQGLSDRLQTEVFRRHDHIGGYCLTELTDVPHELNGVLDLHRQPKPLAVDEIRRANQPVLPMLSLDSLVVGADSDVRAAVHVANDGDPLDDVEIDVRFGGAVAVPLDRMPAGDLGRRALEDRFTESVTGLRVGRLAAHRALGVGEVTVRAPAISGGHDLLLTLRAGGALVATNRYPMHVVTTAAADRDVRVAGPAAEALLAVGARPGASGPLVVAEDHLDADTGVQVREQLSAGGTVVVLAQHPQSAAHYPVPVELAEVETAWGSSVFHFTTDSDALPSLPRRNVLVAEESTVQAQSALVRIDAGDFPDEPVVIAYKPVPGSITGWIVGAHGVGSGRLICCQYRLTAGAVAGDPAARALLRDVVVWASTPRPSTRRRDLLRDDGRSISYYAYGAV
jgi:hypothetical protein